MSDELTGFDPYKVPDRPLEPPDHSAGECPNYDSDANNEDGESSDHSLNGEPAAECDPWRCSNCDEPMPNDFVPNFEEEC